MARLKRFELLTHCLEGSCSIQLSYRRTGRGSKIRTYDHSLPKRVRYQTAPYPEDCDINDNKRNNQSSLHIKFMMRKYYKCQQLFLTVKLLQVILNLK